MPATHTTNEIETMKPPIHHPTPDTSSLTDTVKSGHSDSVLALGKKLADELGTDQRADTLSRWMSHWIAELMRSASGAAGEEQKCFRRGDVQVDNGVAIGTARISRVLHGEGGKERCENHAIGHDVDPETENGFRQRGLGMMMR